MQDGSVKWIDGVIKMKLQRKSIILSAAASIGVTTVIYVFAVWILGGEYRRLEDSIMSEHAHRVVGAIEHELKVLSTQCSDWATWDDTYRYIDDLNDAYADSTLGPESLVTLGVNYICYVNGAGEIVTAVGVDLETEERVFVPDSVQALASGSGPMSQPLAEDEDKMGIVQLPEGPLMYAGRPILTSEGDGPSRGTLIFARHLDSTKAEAIAEITKLPVYLHSMNEHDRGSCCPANVTIDALLKGPVIHAASDDLISGYALITDDLGNPTVLASFELPRTIHQNWNKSLWYLVISFILVGVVFAVLTAVTLNRLVIRRIARMQRSVAHISRSGNLQTRLQVDGNDEITDLALDINTMIEQLNTTQSSLKAAKGEAEAANQHKSLFLANMSHEIRTPMTAILGFADLLMDSTCSDQERIRHINTIKSNGEHLLALINEVLDLSKIESGNMHVESVETSLYHVLDDVVSMMRPRAEAKGLSFDLDCQLPVPRNIQSDPVRLRQILVNLLSNAIKFTESGSVSLSVRWTAPGQQETQLRFEVTDTGIGITQEQLIRLFRPFVQADASTTREFGGTGLGLTISRHLAELLGGSIEVTSTPGVGSRFVLALRLGPVHEHGLLHTCDDQSFCCEATKTPEPALKPTLNARILLAEDGIDNRRLLCLILGKAGAEVDTAENGRIACDLAMRELQGDRPYDLILMDMQMPVMDGYSAATWLRQQQYDGPIVALTAHAMAHDCDKCLASGCDAYATKPIDKQSLLALIHKHINAQPKAA